jgi:hypothetical protein
MNFVKTYLDKQNFYPTLTDQPQADLFLCLSIPCFNEPNLIATLQCIWDCSRPQNSVEVIVVVNSSENASKESIRQNTISLAEGQEWAKNHIDPKLQFHFLYCADLPQKFAGVGLARKIGMDEAVWRLSLAKNPKGIIAGFDADSLCDPNYLMEVEQHFLRHPKSDGASVYFEHPTSGEAFPISTYKGIAQYELHLRYLNQALRFAGHPHAFHTVGSSFAVRMDAYVKQGGMNKRQAGEDFYFLQKIISLENFTEINGTRVIPSPRESDRVPFGTGAAMRLLSTSQDSELKTYSFQCYVDLRVFFKEVPNFYRKDKETIEVEFSKFSLPLQNFLIENRFFEELSSIQSNVSTPDKFRDRFFRWFTVFKVIKFLNHTHANYYVKQDVTVEARKLLTHLGKTPSSEAKELLEEYRALDRKGLHTNQR